MNKIIESAYIVDGQKCQLAKQTKTNKLFITDDGFAAYFTDVNNIVIFEINADSAQGTGFIKSV